MENEKTVCITTPDFIAACFDNDHIHELFDAGWPIQYHRRTGKYVYSIPRMTKDCLPGDWIVIHRQGKVEVITSKVFTQLLKGYSKVTTYSNIKHFPHNCYCWPRDIIEGINRCVPENLLLSKRKIKSVCADNFFAVRSGLLEQSDLVKCGWPSNHLFHANNPEWIAVDSERKYTALTEDMLWERIQQTKNVKCFREIFKNPFARQMGSLRSGVMNGQVLTVVSLDFVAVQVNQKSAPELIALGWPIGPKHVFVETSVVYFYADTDPRHYCALGDWLVKYNDSHFEVFTHSKLLATLGTREFKAYATFDHHVPANHSIGDFPMEKIKPAIPHEVRFDSAIATYHKLSTEQFSVLRELFTYGPLFNENFDPTVFDVPCTHDLFVTAVNKEGHTLFACTHFGAAVVVVGEAYEYVMNNIR